MDHTKQEAIDRVVEFNHYIGRRGLLFLLDIAFKHDEIIRYFEQKGYHQFRVFTKMWKANIDRFDPEEVPNLSMFLIEGLVTVEGRYPELKEQIHRETAEVKTIMGGLQKKLDEMSEEAGIEWTPRENENYIAGVNRLKKTLKT